MSATTLYVIAPNGDIQHFTEFRNGYGGAPAIWSILAHKYLVNVRAPGEDLHNTKRDSMDREVLRELWALGNDESSAMTYPDRLVLWTTYDRVCVRIEDVPAYAKALTRFAETHGPRMKEISWAFSIGQQAEALQEVLAQRETHHWRGVAWDQFGDGAMFPSQTPTVTMRRATVTERLEEEGLIETKGQCKQLTGYPSQVVDLVMDLIDEVVNGEDRVPYNVDHYSSHRWLTTRNDAQRGLRITFG